MKINFIILIFLTLTLMNCGKNCDSNINSKTPEIVINGQSIDKSWCYVDSIVDGVEVVISTETFDYNCSKSGMQRI